jgi:putative AlgH/UPF0301 family transcriptional regulator
VEERAIAQNQLKIEISKNEQLVTELNEAIAIARELESLWRWADGQ